MSADDEEETAIEQELALDLWEGQFEFVGEGYGGDGGDGLGDGGVCIRGGGPIHITPPPRLGNNGIKKTEAHLWCEDLTEQKWQAFVDTELCQLQKCAQGNPREHTRKPKVQMLQQQVSVLADNQNSTDDRYTRAKQDSAALQARVHMLEEQLRESELRAEERLQEEQKRHRELVVRIEREKQLQIENCNIRLQTLELEGASLREESTRLRSQVERLRGEKQASEEQRGEEAMMLAALREELQTLRDTERRAKDERVASAQVVEELSSEIERLKADQKGANMLEARSQLELHGQLHDDLTARLNELQMEVTSLRHQNKNLQETNEELQAQMLTRSLEEGRNLLTGVGSGNSLAEELDAMSAQELRDNTQEQITLEKMRTALKEQQEVNSQLRSYIDGILLNIVDNYPQLLEVKTH